MSDSGKKKINLQKPAGTQDILPEEMYRRRSLARKIEDYFELYGFQQIELPMYDFFNLYKIRSGEKIINDIFTFYDPPKHRADENPELYALRPEYTAPFVRFYITSELMYRPKPLRIFYLGPCFRYDEPAPGRYRQFTQAGVEVFGANTPMADAEILTLAIGLLNHLDLKDFLLRINDLTLLRTYLEETNTDDEIQTKIFGIIDKMTSLLRKIEIGALGDLTKDDIIDDYYAAMNEIGAERDMIEQLEPLLSLVGSPSKVFPKLKELFSNFPKTINAIESSTLPIVSDYLIAAGVKQFVVDCGIARGLDYYTNIVFEIDMPALGKEKQICGGGRYNKLVEEFGGEKTAVTGFAFGFERILLALEKQGKNINVPARAQVFIATKEETRGQGLALAQKLRENGIKVELDIMNRSFRAAGKFVNSMNIPTMLFLGPREVKSGKYTLKNFKTEQQEKDLDFNGLLNKIKEWTNE